MTAPIRLSRGEFRSLLRQAQREAEAEGAGYGSHAEMVEAHRAQRRAQLAARKAERGSLDSTLAEIYENAGIPA